MPTSRSLPKKKNVRDSSVEDVAHAERIELVAASHSTRSMDTERALTRNDSNPEAAWWTHSREITRPCFESIERSAHRTLLDDTLSDAQSDNRAVTQSLCQRSRFSTFPRNQVSSQIGRLAAR